MKKKSYINLLVLSLLAIILVVIDQLAKYLISENLNTKKNYVLINKFISIEYLENKGIAFGALYGKVTFISIFTIIVTIIIVYLIYLLEKRKQLFSSNIDLLKKISILQYIFAILASGALGNIIDRVKIGYVVDFIKFDFIDFPIFNIADCYVVVSATLLFIILLFVLSEEELNSIFRKQ